MVSLTNGEDKMIRFNGSINTKRWYIDALTQVEAHTLHDWISTSLQQLSCFSTVKSRNNHWHRWAPVTGHSDRLLCGRSPARFSTQLPRLSRHQHVDYPRCVFWLKPVKTVCLKRFPQIHLWYVWLLHIEGQTPHFARGILKKLNT